MAFFDFFGFGSKRRTALRGFDAVLRAREVNPAYVDDGMRYIIYKWVTEEEVALAMDPGYVDRRLAEAAQLLAFCVLGAAEAEREFGAAWRAEQERKFDSALPAEADASFEARIVKLALARGIAAPEIVATVELDV
jgi:hypothetical protein